QGTIRAAVVTAAGRAAGGAIPAAVAALTKGELRAMLLNKVKVGAGVLLALAVAGVIAVVGARQILAGNPGSANDEEKILGTWVLVSSSEGGQVAPAERIKDTKVTFTADGKMTVKQGQQEQQFTYKLDPTRDPKEFT